MSFTSVEWLRPLDVLAVTVMLIESLVAAGCDVEGVDLPPHPIVTQPSIKTSPSVLETLSIDRDRFGENQRSRGISARAGKRGDELFLPPAVSVAV